MQAWGDTRHLRLPAFDRITQRKYFATYRTINKALIVKSVNKAPENICCFWRVDSKCWSSVEFLSEIILGFLKYFLYSLERHNFCEKWNFSEARSDRVIRFIIACHGTKERPVTIKYHCQPSHEGRDGISTYLLISITFQLWVSLFLNGCSIAFCRRHMRLVQIKLFWPSDYRATENVKNSCH